ncbi:MAG: hypothetical protein QXS19_06675 [Candidatus Methanomethylicia archaeon]
MTKSLTFIIKKYEGKIEVVRFGFKNKIYISVIGLYDKEDKEFREYGSDKFKETLKRYDLELSIEYMSLSGKTIVGKLLVPDGEYYDMYPRKIKTLRLDTMNRVISVENDEYVIYTYREDKILEVIRFFEYDYDSKKISLDESKLYRIEYKDFRNNVIGNNLKWNKYVVRDLEGIRFWEVYENGNQKFVMSFNRYIRVGDRGLSLKLDSLCIREDNVIMKCIKNIGHLNISDENEFIRVISNEFKEVGLDCDVSMRYGILNLRFLRHQLEKYAFKDYVFETISFENKIGG